ncbi:MAG: anti-sigma factor [Chitinophagaceae bacterium]|nr:anti-sigma factor [Chitinophagaceae bacterium]
MNIKEYISGGIVESYVLGMASEEECREFEQLCVQYPELVAARNEFEESLEKQAFDKAVPPPSFLKEKILSNIRGQDASGKEAKIVSMNARPQNSGWLRYVAAAAVILFVASGWFAFDQYSKRQKLAGSYSRLQYQIDSVNTILARQQQSMIDPDASMVVNMQGTQPSSVSSASIYWDTASSNVFLVVRNLPQLPTEKQYQLWAFIEGKPVDLGLFDWDSKNVILQMKNTQKAEAFAITIENRGNGAVPQGPVETMGKISL